MIVHIPKQPRVSTVWPDMISQACQLNAPFALALNTQRKRAQPHFAVLRPSVIVPSLCRCPAPCVYLLAPLGCYVLMYLAIPIGIPCHPWACRLSAWSWRPIHTLQTPMPRRAEALRGYQGGGRTVAMGGCEGVVIVHNILCVCQVFMHNVSTIRFSKAPLVCLQQWAPCHQFDTRFV